MRFLRLLRASLSVGLAALLLVSLARPGLVKVRVATEDRDETPDETPDEAPASEARAELGVHAPRPHHDDLLSAHVTLLGLVPPPAPHTRPRPKADRDPRLRPLLLQSIRLLV